MRRSFLVIVTLFLAVDTLSAQEAEQVRRVGQIFIVGNSKTPSSTILEALSLTPGRELRDADVGAAEKALKKLDCFVVDPKQGIRPTVKILDGEGVYRDVVVTVKEKTAATDKTVALPKSPPSDYPPAVAKPAVEPVPEEGQVFYIRAAKFHIPFTTTADSRIHKIHLHVSADGGRSYEKVGSAEPQEKGFTFHAPKDGCYLFWSQTEDGKGELWPEKMVGICPHGIQVVVDTTPPTVELHAQYDKKSSVHLDWQVQDENLDLATLRIDYRIENGEWQSLEAPKKETGSLRWKPDVTKEICVRVLVKDKAGNVGEKTVRIVPKTP